MDVRVTHATAKLDGTVHIPADKSMSHRAVMFAAAAEGTSQVNGALGSDDVRSTIAAVQALGAEVGIVRDAEDGLFLGVTGWGVRGPRQPSAPIDCGNSGTTARLLMGLVAGWPIEVTFTGDASLSGRPMLRIADPLRAMGATVDTAEGGTLPVRVHGGGLRPIEYVSPVASAQVKSAVLLAGLQASGCTVVIEPAKSRDHTERMLPAFGVPVEAERGSLTVSVTGPVVPSACDFFVPADPSSAAFFTVAGVLVPNSRVIAPRVSLNPTRAGFVRVLERMGARIRVDDLAPLGTEEAASLQAWYSEGMSATTIEPAEVPSLIDEVPIVALAATQAAGTTRFEGVGELRVKESDRLEAVRAGLEAFGADVRAGEDWLEVSGPTPLAGCTVPSLADHRLAMTWIIAGLIAQGETVVEGADAVGVSYPAFVEHLQRLGAPVEWA